MLCNQKEQHFGIDNDKDTERRDYLALCNTQRKLELELYMTRRDLQASKKETSYWKHLYQNLDKSICIEDHESNKQQNIRHHTNDIENCPLSHIISDPPDEGSPCYHETLDFLQQSSEHYSQISSPSTETTLSPTHPTLTDRIKQLELETEQHILTKYGIVAQGLMDTDQFSMDDDEYLMLHGGDIISDSFIQVYNDEGNSSTPQRNQELVQPETPVLVSLKDDLSMEYNQDRKPFVSYQEMMEEIKTLKDTNHALRHYINKILMRIMNNRHMETILSIDRPGKQITTLRINPHTIKANNLDIYLAPADQTLFDNNNNHGNNMDFFGR
ncbi:hypothetical protein BC941DRAFT_432972 [Chlamydoabsidia padenii]|nr:hypothetical protein BC941DRAFT_432972 [Chlamydoabsidia padenii]